MWIIRADVVRVGKDALVGSHVRNYHISTYCEGSCHSEAIRRHMPRKAHIRSIQDMSHWRTAVPEQGVERQIAGGRIDGEQRCAIRGLQCQRSARGLHNSGGQRVSETQGH